MRASQGPTSHGREQISVTIHGVGFVPKERERGGGKTQPCVVVVAGAFVVLGVLGFRFLFIALCFVGGNLLCFVW